MAEQERQRLRFTNLICCFFDREVSNTKSAPCKSYNHDPPTRPTISKVKMIVAERLLKPILEENMPQNRKLLTGGCKKNILSFNQVNINAILPMIYIFFLIYHRYFYNSYNEVEGGILESP